MTALTFVLAVGVPSGLTPAGADSTALAASRRRQGAIDVAIIPHVEVGGRDTTMADRQHGRRG